MENKGEKNVRFRSVGPDGKPGQLSSIQFQVTDVTKALASVSRILDQGNSVLFTRKPGGSRIMKDSSDWKDFVPIREENRTFVLDVEFLEPADSESRPFQRPAN